MDKDDKQMQKDIEEGQQRKKQSEWQRIEQMVIDKQKNEEEEEEKRHLEQIMSNEQTQTLLIDEHIVQEVEKGGYPRSYIVKSLNSDELNYATSFYYLLTTDKEYWTIFNILA